MDRPSRQSRRRPLGRISSETKGPPGVFMEGTGLWDRHRLTD
jgi:hypothetical protein